MSSNIFLWHTSYQIFFQDLLSYFKIPKHVYRNRTQDAKHMEKEPYLELSAQGRVSHPKWDDLTGKKPAGRCPPWTRCWWGMIKGWGPKEEEASLSTNGVIC
jgi:hypothetical protein